MANKILRQINFIVLQCSAIGAEDAGDATRIL